MSETYEIYTPNGLTLDVEKDTNKILVSLFIIHKFIPFFIFI